MRPRSVLLCALLALAAATVPACASPDDAPTTAEEQDLKGPAADSKKQLFEGEEYYVRVVGWNVPLVRGRSGC